jgi:phosphopantetheinyl transferase
LTAFVEDILRGRPHLAFPCDVPWRSSITQLNHLIGLLAAQGVDMRLDYLYERRSPNRLSLEHPARNGDGDAKPSGHLTLALDLPTMRLSPERIRSLAAQSPVPVDGLRFAPASQEGQRPTGAAPALGTLTPFAEPLGRFAFGPAGLDKDGALSLQPDVTRQVMLEHLHTMGRFLAVEQQIMEEFLDGSGDVLPQETGETPPVAAAPFFPFIGTIVSLIPGQEAVIRRRIDLDQDLFLQDHRFGGRGSDTDQSLEPLSVMPFTMCMEIMAEAAALLMPGKVLTAMRQIEVRQWIEADTPIALEITARRTSGEEVNVQIKNLGNAPESEAPAGVPTAEGTAIFGDAYPQPPPIVPLSLTAERPCRYTAKQMYEERLMFHGPRFQGVATLEGLGRNGIVGQLQVLPQTDLFKSTTAPDLLTDPVLLDAAAQPIGPWAVEHLDAGYVLLPFRLSALEIYGPHPRVSERMRFEVEIQTVTPQHVGATINLFDADGRIRVRLVDWEDWRFFMPRALYDYLRFPKRYLLSSPWDVPISRLPRPETFICQRLDPTPEHTRSVTMRTVAHTLLSRAERLQWPEAKGAGNRRAEWLFGRAAAKDAVRRLLRERDDINAPPADIEIDHDQDGRPFVRLLGLGASATAPSISIAHSDGFAVAIAGHCSEGERLGIDIERIRAREGPFQEIAFHADELTLLDAFAGSARDEWVTRLWCAKEATAKALGKGLLEGPRSLTVRKVDATTGTLEVVLGDRLAREFPELAGVPLVVYTAREEDWAVASTVCEKRSP